MRSSINNISFINSKCSDISEKASKHPIKRPTDNTHKAKHGSLNAIVCRRNDFLINISNMQSNISLSDEIFEY
jgi:hypothetical protein